jgi:hypothetical protein
VPRINANKTYFAARLKPEDLKGRGDNHPLLLVVRRWNTFEGLEPLQGELTLLGLVWDHSTHCAPKDLSRSTEMERSTKGFDVATKSQKLQVLQLVTVKVSAHVDTLTPDDDNLVAIEDELSDDRGQTAHQVATAIDHNRLKGETLILNISVL